ncbi:hypothetical protein J6590_102462 [Homalodisca vitripennis]|nr:hypothetical protein J6590_102462 [Homalodisca vitripennis]
MICQRLSGLSGHKPPLSDLSGSQKRAMHVNERENWLMGRGWSVVMTAIRANDPLPPDFSPTVRPESVCLVPAGADLGGEPAAFYALLHVVVHGGGLLVHYMVDREVLSVRYCGHNVPGRPRKAMIRCSRCP